MLCNLSCFLFIFILYNFIHLLSSLIALFSHFQVPRFSPKRLTHESISVPFLILKHFTFFFFYPFSFPFHISTLFSLTQVDLSADSIITHYSFYPVFPRNLSIRCTSQKSLSLPSSILSTTVIRPSLPYIKTCIVSPNEFLAFSSSPLTPFPNWSFPFLICDFFF